jgi:hypothetical protein
LVVEAVVAKKFVAVAFWSVDEPLTKKLFAKKKPVEVALPKSARVANDWVLEAVEAKSAVEVALPETTRLPVVVAPPLMVSPVRAVPPPIVLEPVLPIENTVDDAEVMNSAMLAIDPPHTERRA